MSPILPGQTLGVLGSGQLGRMFAMAAQRMGYRVHVFSTEADAPADAVADRAWVAAYDDVAALEDFAASVDAVTLEFENIAPEAVARLAKHVPVRPGAGILSVAQHRLREKTALAGLGIPLAPFAAVSSADDLPSALAATGLPAILKTAGFGYDGKGQQRVASVAEAQAAVAQLAGEPAVLEGVVPFLQEISVLVARRPSGQTVCAGVFENQHAHHILDVTVFPARVPAAVAAQATELATRILAGLEGVGLLCVECFVTAEGAVLVNEIAPRPHNSGHVTMEALTTSQFALQVQALCDLPLGSVAPVAPAAAMANLLGDLWADGEPNWAGMMADFPDVVLHLYGKRAARPGRKMGHLTVLAETPDAAEARIRAARQRLRPTPALG